MFAKRQFRCFFKIFIKLKLAKFFWLLLVGLCLVSNHYLYIPVARLIGIYGQKYVDIKEASTFVQDNEVLVQRDRYTNEIATIDSILRELGTRSSDPGQIFTPCHSQEDCSAKHFDLLYRGSSTFASLLDFKGNKTTIVCNMVAGGELYCPFLGYLAGVGQLKRPDTPIRFKAIRMFRSIGRYKPDGGYTVTEGHTLCDLEAKYPSIFPGVVTAHAMLTVGSLFFYFLLSTLQCIYDLKGNGFLQMMVQKGLSIRAYWLVIWLITSLEILACAGALTASYASQCNNFYLTSSLLRVFSFSVVQFYCIAGACLIMTVVVKAYSQAVVTIGMTAILAMLLNLVNRLLFVENDRAKIAALFLPPGHLGEYIQAALLAESTGTPLSVYHLATFVMAGTVAFVLILATLYFDFVLETGNGLRLAPNFVLNKAVWSSQKDQPEASHEQPEVVIQLASVEKLKEDLRPVISVNNLTVVKTGVQPSCCFNAAESAPTIKNINVTIYESHITAIIGHNGSGKSTLLGILSGSRKATSGQVYIDGFSLNNPLASLRLRGKFGICSQHDTLSNSLTMKQSIELALTSCGCYQDEMEDDLVSMLNLLRLSEKIANCVGTLSGGQKRKLCIALALLGNPKVVVMDEPTSGVDPVSRRRIWKLLQDSKFGRAIILSTQFMDEADTLADRKILLSAGSLICAGSSMFLKSIFDCGFIFKVTLKSADLIPVFMKHVNKDFHTVKLKKQFRTNLELQVSANELDVLPNFAAFLEKRADILTGYGLAQPTLGDIFMRLKDMTPDAVQRLFESKTVSLLASDAVAAENLSTIGSLAPKNALDTLQTRAMKPSALKRIVAVFVMNIRRIRRTKVELALRLIIPILLLLGLVCASIAERLTRDPNRQNRRVMHYKSLQFSKGVCVYDYPSSKDNTTPTPEVCNRLLNANPAASVDAAAFKIMSKEEVISIISFMENKDVSQSLSEFCGSKDGDSKLQCPVFHTDIWDKSVSNVKREANIGMFSVSSTSNISIVSSTIMSIYSRCMDYFASSESSRTKIRVEGVDDFMAVFLHLFGVFVQIVILSIVPATYLEDAVEDKEAKVRCQLSTMGVTSLYYWITIFIVHWLQYAITYGISILLLICIFHYNYLNAFYLIGIVLPTLVFGLTNNLLCAYIVSTFLNRFNQLARVGYIFLSLLIGSALLAVQLNSSLGIFMIYALPPFASVSLTFYGTKVYFFTDAYYWIDGVQSKPRGLSIYFSHLHVYNSIIAMVCHTVLLVALLSLTDSRTMLFHQCESMCSPPDHSVYPAGEDPGVSEETDRIDGRHRSNLNILEVRHIRKVYPNGVKAIRDATFGVMSGEIFGLLGPNGAGKTSTLSIVVGDERVSAGDCEINFNKRWLKSCNASKLGAVGYCPQHNPLFPGITIAEHMWFYAKILGIHENLAQHDIDLLVEALGLQEHLNTQTGNLSEGLKRRTCLAISMLGNPAIIVIDEASTGVDPEGKRFIWSVIRSMANSHRALIITTHSMEEAEALCTRVGIMNHGLLVGLGSVAQLVNLYGEWYTLDILIKAQTHEQSGVVRSRKDRAIKSVMAHFKNSKILDQFTCRVTFSIPSESVHRLSAALGWLVANKDALHLQCFSFYQLSLDQVFEYLLKTHDEQIQKQRRVSVFSVTTQLSEFDNGTFA